MKQKLNLDTYRLIASLLIIAIHVYPFLTVNKNLEFIFTHIFCRIGVPFFLMLTGNFILPKSLENIDNLKNYIKKIITIYIISIIIYIPINVYTGVLKNTNIINILKMILIDGTMYHLWYFPALILGLWITYFLIKKLKNKSCIIILITLFIIGLLGDSYYGLTENIKYLKIIYEYIFKIFNYTRNGLFYVPIFLYEGYSLKKQNKNNNNKKNIIISLTFLTLMIIEGIILHHYELQKHDSMYIFLIPLMYYIFKTLINNNYGKKENLRKISTILYIMHPFFIVLIRLIGKIFKIEKIIVNNSLIHYILVTAITLTFAIYFEKITKKYKQNIKRVLLMNWNSFLGYRKRVFYMK